MDRMTTRRGLAFCAAALVTGGACAGTVEQATVFAEPQMQVNDGALQGCGYRIKSIPKFDPDSVVVLDMSFNIYSPGFVLMKGGAVQFDVKDGRPDNPVVRPIAGFWLKAPNMRPTTALNGKLTPAENKGYLLYGEKVDAVMRLFNAVWDREALTLGMRIKGESIDRIHTGTVQVSDEDVRQVQQCFDELVQQMERELESEGAKTQ